MSDRPVFVDPRVGSLEIAPSLRQLALPVQELTLEFGDFAFEGNGPDGMAMIGIERKVLSDMLASMRSGRFAGHQLPGLLTGYHTVYLLLEGVYRCGDGGVLEKPAWSRGGGRGTGWEPVRLGTSGFLYSELTNFLTSLENLAGLKIRHTASRAQTAQTIEGLYHWWGKQWDAHKSLGVVYTPGQQTLDLTPLTLIRKVAVQLPGVGWQKSVAIDRKWKSVLDMVIADQEDWESLPGFGKLMAKQIVDALRGDE